MLIGLGLIDVSLGLLVTNTVIETVAVTIVWTHKLYYVNTTVCSAFLMMDTKYHSIMEHNTMHTVV